MKLELEFRDGIPLSFCLWRLSMDGKEGRSTVDDTFVHRAFRCRWVLFTLAWGRDTIGHELNEDGGQDAVALLKPERHFPSISLWSPSLDCSSCNV